MGIRGAKKAFSTAWVTNERTGFVNQTESALAFSDSSPDRTLTITPVGDYFDFYQANIRYRKTAAETIQISADHGMHYIYYDNGVLGETVIFSRSLITEKVWVASVYWDSTNSVSIYLGDERHGIAMSGPTHEYLHDRLGTAWESGLALDGILADEAGDDDTHAQFGYEAGAILDEDLQHSIARDTAPASIPLFYKDGATDFWRRDAASNFPVKSFSGGSGRLARNEFTGGAWQQTEIDNVKFVLTHIFATNDSAQPVIAVQGEEQYDNQISARQGAADEINEITTAGLPFAEFVPLGTIIFQTSTGYTNAVKARIRTTDEGDDYVDFRQFTLSSVGSVNNHSNLSGLTNVDHPASAIENDSLVVGVTTRDAFDTILGGISNPTAGDGITFVTADTTGATTPGAITVTPGDSDGDVPGGVFNITGGAANCASSVDAGGNVNITGGASTDDGATDSGDGGEVRIKGGDSESQTSGGIWIDPGQGVGGDTNGEVRFGAVNLPNVGFGFGITPTSFFHVSNSREETTVIRFNNTHVNVQKVKLVVGSGDAGFEISNGTLLLKASSDNTFLSVNSGTPNNAMSLSSGRLSINPSSNDFDIRWDADGIADAFVCDAGDAEVRIGGGFDSTGITMDMAGNLSTDGDIIAANFVDPATNNFRLSLTTAMPVTTSDVTAASTLYLAQYTGNHMAVHDGTRWLNLKSAELSLNISGYTADRVYDIFAYSNSGTLAIESLIWTDGLNRATALTRLDGMLVKTGDTTRRYVGTIRITDTLGECEDSVLHRYVWNWQNQVERRIYWFDTTGHTYETNTYRQWRATAANKTEFIVGLASMISVHVRGFCDDSGRLAGVIDNTTSPPSWNAVLNTLSTEISLDASGNTYVTEGYHYGTIIQYGDTGADFDSGIFDGYVKG